MLQSFIIIHVQLTLYLSISTRTLKNLWDNVRIKKSDCSNQPKSCSHFWETVTPDSFWENSCFWHSAYKINSGHLVARKDSAAVLLILWNWTIILLLFVRIYGHLTQNLFYETRNLNSLIKSMYICRVICSKTWIFQALWEKICASDINFVKNF